MTKKRIEFVCLHPPLEERGDRYGDHSDFDRIFRRNHRSPDRSQRALVDRAYRTRHYRREAVPVI